MGRPSEDRPRHPCGKLVQATPPTPELVQKRIVLVGEDKAADPRAGFPLGVLYLRHAIFHGDYAAGMRFAGLYAALWGKGQVKSHLEAVIYGLRGAVERDDPNWEKRQLQLADQLGEATAALLALPTRRPYHVLVNLAVYERPMRFMDNARARTPAAWAADQRDLEALQEATGTLAELWGIERKAN